MKKFTANYSHSNHNFVIQNLEGERVDNEYLPAICILKNILQRGKPTLMSTFLQEKIGAIHKEDDFEKPCPLIDKEPPKWERRIRGDDKGNYNPAKKFHEDIPKHLPDYAFIQQLLLPEVSINDITQREVDEFAQQQVDFYLPQAYLIIEIDGSQHVGEQKEKDDKRDDHTKEYGIQTIRIQTSDLKEENDSFREKIEKIIKRIKQAEEEQKKRRESGKKTFISLDDYKTAFKNGVDIYNPLYKATAIMRFQILLLELLEYGRINFNEPWSFEIIERDAKDFAELAIEDLFEWFRHLLNLQKVKFNKPEFTIRKVKEFSSTAGIIKVDFSLLKRYTDEHQTQPKVIFVRTCYLDEFKRFKRKSSSDTTIDEQYDHFKVSTCPLVNYKLELGDNSSDEKSLRLLMWNIFLQNNENLDCKTLQFREGQLPIIANALSRNDTLGLLTTGAGKSVCYQLAAILQPAVSFVVCPIKALMYDQKADLDSAFFSRTNHITSDDDAETRDRAMNEFGKGKYLFIFIAPERFQTKAFRQAIKQVNKTSAFAYAVIDEVHCLSEWGHDFRLAYLNLANTIRSCLSGDFKFLALTATASLSVLKDIQAELLIKREDIKTLEDYTRRELEFIIKDDNGDKYGAVCRLLQPLMEQPVETQNQAKCGIIFTPIVNSNSHNKGCHALSLDLSKKFKTDIKFFSGKSPTRTIPQNGKKEKIAIYKDKEFAEMKKETQTEFKNNKFSWLVATKSFGMGLNKDNIYYTVHYGIPMSTEALYQEAGRAGRDKTKFEHGNEKAQCFVLLTKSANEQIFEEGGIWDKQTTVPRLEKLKSQVTGDLSTNFFLFLKDQDSLTEEFAIARKLHQYIKCIIGKDKTKIIKIKANHIKYTMKQNAKPKNAQREKTEKAIYRLAQLGIIKDWTVKYTSSPNEFEITVANINEQCIKEHLMETINKYESKSFQEIDKEYEGNFDKLLQFTGNVENTITNKCIFYLIQWTYDNFAYTRRQSLKDLYENCLDVVEGRKDKDQFKSAIEYYFRITTLSGKLQRIAESPTLSMEKFFEVFYQIEGESVTDTFIGRQEQENMKSALSRFLESYRNNTGLDMVSGLLRLLLDDYENTDGRIRLESALERIQNQNYEKDKIDLIIKRILEIGKKMNDKNKALLAKSLYKYFDDVELLHRLQETLDDSYSRTILLQKANNRLKTVKEKIHGRSEKT